MGLIPKPAFLGRVCMFLHAQATSSAVQRQIRCVCDSKSSTYMSIWTRMLFPTCQSCDSIVTSPLIHSLDSFRTNFIPRGSRECRNRLIQRALCVSPCTLFLCVSVFTCTYDVCPCTYALFALPFTCKCQPVSRYAIVQNPRLRADGPYAGALHWFNLHRGKPTLMCTVHKSTTVGCIYI